MLFYLIIKVVEALSVLFSQLADRVHVEIARTKPLVAIVDL